MVLVTVAVGASLAVADPALARPQVSHSQESLVRIQWPLRAIGASKVVDQNPDLASVVVATLDTGVDLRHPELRRRVWRNPRATPAPLSGRVVPRGAAGWDLLGDDSRPYDRGGHGTAVAGLIAAQAGNGRGIDGVAPNARLMALRACTQKNSNAGIECVDHSYAAAIDWAASHGARVVHLSWSLGGGPEVSSAIAAHPEVLFVATSGNGYGTNVDASASNCALPVANLICVAVSDRSEGPASCTSVGPRTVDLSAPGVNVTTTLVRHRYLLHSQCAATFAAPHVSGAAALLFGAMPGADPAAVKQAIVDGASPASALGGMTVSGGILDVASSLQILRQRVASCAAPGATGDCAGHRF